MPPCICDSSMEGPLSVSLGCSSPGMQLLLTGCLRVLQLERDWFSACGPEGQAPCVPWAGWVQWAELAAMCLVQSLSMLFI